VKKPRAFSGIEVYNLPVHYYQNKSAWMDREMFCDWFRKKVIPSVRQHFKSLDLPQKSRFTLG
jgi:hypothetical protein